MTTAAPITRLANSLIEQSADELATAAETAQRAARELTAVSQGMPTDNPQELMQRAHAAAAEAHRLVGAALTVRAAAARMGAVGVLAKEEQP